ncbi:MAG: sulfur transferase domain-containing protein, partial [Pseudomonadota bacterium]
MDIRRVTENFSVSPQIEVADIPAIAEAGFTTIVCNRPDQEQEGQPGFAEIEEAATQAGI